MPATPILGLFVVALIELGLALAVLLRGPRRSANRWFAAFATALALWGSLVGLRRSLHDPILILAVLRVLFAAAALMPLTFLQFAAVFPRPTRSRQGLRQAAALTGLFISGLAFSPWIVVDVRQPRPDYFQPVYGTLYPVFALYVIVCFAWGVAELAAQVRNTTGFARAQLHYVWLGTTLGAMGAIVMSLVVPLVTGSSRLSLFGPYFPLILVGFAAHSIVRHRLMDIRVVISRTAAYTLGWGLTTGLLVGGVVFVDTLFPQKNPTLSPVGAVILGLAASGLFVASSQRLKRLADRYLYRPAYDARQLVREGSRAMGTVGDPARVVGAMAELINQAFHLERLAIVVWDRDREAFPSVYTHHVDPAHVWPGRLLNLASPLVRELETSAGALVPDDLMVRPDPIETGPILADLRAWGAEVAVPVRDGQLIAIILAGPKLAGDPFFQEDLDLLETLASELAIGLKNAQLYHEVVSIKEYNERILAHMDSGVIAVREDGVVTTFNPAAERIIGQSAARILGQVMARLTDAVEGVLRDSLTGQKDAETEITVTHSEGRVLPLVVHTSALHDAKGQVRGAIAVLNDHSRLKALEEDKRRADRLAALGAMATGIAHEIRNPLVAIKTFAELLPDRADDHEFRSTFAKVAVKEIHRIEQLLGRLRALAVPTAFPLRPLDLQMPIVDTVDLLRGEADRRRVRFLVEI
ncbi:MAG TPA: PAS domain-containing protein, partial [Methylomirabilota bacterium]|nr:PAS domain-containing protein [Methylomirabilota bacterium]